MPNVQDVLTYARHQADALEKDMCWEQTEFGGYWKANNEIVASRIAARATAALELFRRYSGAESYWTRRATVVYESKNSNQSAESGARALGELLRAWSDQVETGVAEIFGARAWAEIGVASTDLMGQVRNLLEDRRAHPSAAIVLCGAALEIGLRAVAEAHNLILEERPSLSAYSRLLRGASLITLQEVKDLEQCAGLRNSAAHGEFEHLSHERAGLMEQQTNILLRRIGDLQG